MPARGSSAISAATALHCPRTTRILQQAPNRAAYGRVVRKVPDVIESFRELAPPLLNDRHHGVLLSGVTLALQICELEPSAVVEYRMHVSALACMGPAAAHNTDEKWSGVLHLAGRSSLPACVPAVQTPFDGAHGFDCKSVADDGSITALALCSIQRLICLAWLHWPCLSCSCCFG